ncbi:TPA: hypothetical protein ACH3X1_006904 [Trebouxia sp. C0004]
MSFFYVKLTVSDLQTEVPSQHHKLKLFRLNKSQNRSKTLIQRPHLHMKSRAIINIVYTYRNQHCVTTQRKTINRNRRPHAQKLKLWGSHSPETRCQTPQSAW